jgi:hypothetical protein
MSDNDIYIDFSSDEVNSEARTFEAIPAGKYEVYINELEIREVRDGDNAGKPYWNTHLVIDGGDYDNRHLFTSIMLFNVEGKNVLFKLSQLLKACGYDVSPGNFKVPPATELVGKKVVAFVQRKKDTWAMKEENGWDGKTTIMKNEINGFATIGSDAAKATSGAKAGAGSILP